MKPFDIQTNLSAPLESTAALVTDVIPLVMRAIRAEMRGHRADELSVPQFRALAFIGRTPGASLSDVAEQVGLTLPSTSTMVNRLEAQGLITRRAIAGDRRRIALHLTDSGETELERVRAITRAHLAERLAGLPPEDLEMISSALLRLRAVFGAEPEPSAQAGSEMQETS